MMQVVPGSEGCINGHPVVYKPMDGRTWKCGELTCAYYVGTPTPEPTDELQEQVDNLLKPLVTMFAGHRDLIANKVAEFIYARDRHRDKQLIERFEGLKVERPEVTGKEGPITAWDSGFANGRNKTIDDCIALIKQEKTDD